MTFRLLLNPSSSSTSIRRAACGLALALALPGCILDTKIGDKPGISDGDTDEPAGTETDEPSATDGTGASATDGTGATDATATDGTTAGTDTPMAECEGLDEAACAANPACMTRHGWLYGSPCRGNAPHYLGCIEQQECGEIGLDICSEAVEGDVYAIGDSCVPPGYFECQLHDAQLCVEDCETLGEQECLAVEYCKAHYGSPHVMQDGLTCVDFAQTEFLGCGADLGECPPAVPTVCPEGQTEPAWDVPSGCVPPGFEMCEDGTPACR